MKKLILLLTFLFCLHSSFSQNKYVDSLKELLSSTKKPMDSFSIIVKIAENIAVLNGGNVNSSTYVPLLHIAEELKNDSLLAISYNWIASYLAFIKGDNTSALEYFFKAIPLAEGVHDKRRVSSLYFDIAIVYFNLQNNEEAFKNIKKGGENLPDKDSPMYDFMLVQYQRNMAKYYLVVNQYDSAFHYAQALSETTKRLKAVAFQYDDFFLNGAIHAKMRDIEIAEAYFKKANAISSLIGSNAQLDFFLTYIPFLIDINKMKQAQLQASKLMELGRRESNNNFKLYAALFMQQVFDSLHQQDSAYYYSKLKDNLNALIFSQNNINKAQALNFNEQLRIMEDNAKKEEERLQRRENLQYALIAIGIVALLMLYLLLSRSFITNLKVIEFFGVIGLLIVFEFLNLLLHPFLQKITNHSPVLMLFALVCIAALLVPLHHKIEKWTTVKMIEKNKKIRLASAKKTIQQLEG